MQAVTSGRHPLDIIRADTSLGLIETTSEQRAAQIRRLRMQNLRDVCIYPFQAETRLLFSVLGMMMLVAAGAVTIGLCNKSLPLSKIWWLAPLFALYALIHYLDVFLPTREEWKRIKE